jgi:hypothetical protein
VPLDLTAAVDFTFLKAFVLQILAQKFSTDDKRQVKGNQLPVAKLRYK